MDPWGTSAELDRSLPTTAIGPIWQDFFVKSPVLKMSILSPIQHNISHFFVRLYVLFLNSTLIGSDPFLHLLDLIVLRVSGFSSTVDFFILLYAHFFFILSWTTVESNLYLYIVNSQQQRSHGQSSYRSCGNVSETNSPQQSIFKQNIIQTYIMQMMF